jgi:type II secretory pathway pseudopilin PulG
MPRSAYTLLEIVLALALGAVVLGILGVAVDVHLSGADSGRAEVEQAQLARALLHRVAEDLRATIPYSQSPSSDTSSDTTSSASGDTTGQQSTSGTTTTEAPTSDTTASQGITGFHGTQTQLQFDFRRLPRPSKTATLATDSVSDARTVIYGVVDPTGLTESAAEQPASAMHGGLVRRELSAAAFAQSAEQGESLDASAEVLAPEVVKVDFEYCDGSTFQTEWDSDVQGSLPVAVRVTVYLVRPKRRRSLVALESVAEQPTLVAYSLLVELPNAQVKGSQQ